MDLSLHFAGTAGSVPTARRGLPATLLRAGGDRILFDCGEGTQRQLIRSVGLVELDAIFLTHHHIDHWLGLPGLFKSFDLRDRDRELLLYGPPGTAALLQSVRPTYGRLGYPLTITDLEAGDVLEWDGYEIEAFNVQHRGRAFGYAIVEEDRPGRFDAERAVALGVRPGPDFGRLQAGETVDGVTPDQVIGEDRRGRRIVLSGDTRPCDAVRAHAAGADLLVHESTFLHEDLARAGETGHTTARQAAELAAEADVGLLALTHVSQRYHPRALREEARAVFARTELPRDHDHVVVPFPEKGPPELVRAARPEPATPQETAA
ncbi:ribonuclease Z [Conexibacter sp. W3-3-2]|uniref:ribonuclease Z n=1 Tax=Conexibacter sp. W3-3-2 TaxID=2675227 RepID=UPI00132A5027|nr:ribonuclease Z [Conexibacter sp. W3-3-2]MTD43137.1 ribonuclease Z [Conexibacter sp. W3-3-2]